MTPEQKALRREYQKAWRKANPGKCARYSEKWRKANLGVRRAAAARHRARNPLEGRTRKWKRAGLDVERATALLAIATGCEICGTVPSLLCVDHDHKTGKVRGVLCTQCNQGLGLFRDRIDLLEKAKEYLAHAAK